MLIDPEQARVTHGQVGSSIGGWFSFQPMLEWILHQEPDLLD